MSQGHSEQILVVDDEVLAGVQLQRVLEKEGYRSWHFVSGQDCIRWIEVNGVPDLIIMDINLGEVNFNGPEVVRNIQSAWEVPVVLHSAYTDKATLEETKNLAQYGYIHKVPGNSELVLATVRLALRLYKTEKELKQQRLMYQDLSGHLQDLQDNLKSFLAREIHDDLGQSLTALKINLSFLKNHVNSPDGNEILGTMREILNQAVQKSRSLIEQLRPPVIESTGICEVLEWHCRDFGKNFQVHTWFKGPNQEPNLDSETKLMIFRIVQEALTNGVHHGEAKSLGVEVFEPNNGVLTLVIYDDGKGLSPEFSTDNHFGILGMEERARRFNGTIDISSIPGEGTRITLQVPMEVLA